MDINRDRARIVLSFLSSPPQKITIKDAPPFVSRSRHHRETDVNKRHPLPLPEKSRFTIKGEARTRRENENFLPLSFSFPENSLLELFRDYNNAADIPGNHVSRRDHAAQRTKVEHGGEKEEQSGTMRCNASLMTVRKFQRVWIIHGGKQKGVEVVSDRAVLHRLNRWTGVVHRPVCNYIPIFVTMTGWKLG